MSRTILCGVTLLMGVCALAATGGNAAVLSQGAAAKQARSIAAGWVEPVRFARGGRGAVGHHGVAPGHTAAVGHHGVAAGHTAAVGHHGVATGHHAAVRRPIIVNRPWIRRPYYGTVIAGVTLGTIIAAGAVGVVPAAPQSNLCWYWADPSGTRGYWDYCQ